MVNLLTGPKGSGKTQQMIEQANKQAKECKGNVVFIKKTPDGSQAQTPQTQKKETRHAARRHVMYSLSDSIWHNIWHQSSVA